MSAATDKIASMVVGVGADPSELKRGLTEGARAVEDFTQHVNVTADRMRDLLKQTGGDLVKAARLAAREADASFSKVAPISDAPSFKGPTGRDYSAGVRAIAESRSRMMREAIRRSDQQLAGEIARSDVFTRGFAQQGTEAGLTLGRSMSRGFNQANVAGNIRRALGGAGGGGFFENIFGKGTGIGTGRATAAFITGAFTLAGLGDAFASGDSKITRFTQGLNQVLRSASVVAAFFGPTGLLVSAVLAGTSFVLDFFAKTRDAADKMAKETEDRIKRLIDARDNAGQLSRVQELTVGLPSAGGSALVPGEFAGGIDDLEAQINAAYDRIVEHNASAARQMINAVTQQQRNAIHRGNDQFIADTQTAIRALIAQLSPLVQERDRLTAAILDPTTSVRATPPSPIKTTAPAVGHEFDQLAGRIQKTIALYRALEEAGNPVSTQTQQLVDGFITLSHALSDLAERGADPFSNQVTSLQQLQAEIEKTLPRLSQLKDLTRPGGRLTPGGAPEGRPGAAPTVDATPHFDALTRTLGVSLSNVVATIGRTIGGTIQATLGVAMGPVALLFRALEPALRVLDPLLDKLVAPIAAVAQVIVTSLEPTLRALFPIIKAFGIVVAFVSEVSSRAAALLARVLGNIVVAIGKLLQKITLGFAGKGLERLGTSFLKFADGAKQSADEMGRVRKELYGMDFGDTADSITGLGDAAKYAAAALINVPAGFRVELERYLASIPEAGPRQPSTPSGSGVPVAPTQPAAPVAPGNPHTPSIVIQSLTVQSSATNGRELLRDVAREAQRYSMQVYGTTVRAGEVLGMLK
jgi:hypothetical protein